jgi:putative phosphoesterase
MRVLLCSDIHGNAAALNAILADQADYVLCAGDLVHFGPQPDACIELIHQQAAAVTQGNHDYGAGFGYDCRAHGPWRAIDEASRDATDALLSVGDRRFLQTLPRTETRVLDGVRFAVVHAAPTDPLYRYLAPDTPETVWRTELSLVEADVLVLGHTHIPLLRRDGRTLIVNHGSVGLPRDGHHDAQYSVWEDGVVTFHRAAYDQTPLLDAVSRLPLPVSAARSLMALFGEGEVPGA